jgi:hypothetical protein
MNRVCIPLLFCAAGVAHGELTCLHATLLSSAQYPAAMLSAASGGGPAAAFAAAASAGALAQYDQLLVLRADVAGRRLREDYFALDGAADAEAAADAAADAAAGLAADAPPPPPPPWRRHSTLSDFERGALLRVLAARQQARRHFSSFFLQPLSAAQASLLC